MNEWENVIAAIGDLNAEAMASAKERQDRLTKPAGSLGVLEQLSIRLAGMSGQVCTMIGRKTVVVMAGDHGVTEEGVSAYPSEVTGQMVLNFLGGGAAINVLARHEGVEVIVVDMGVKSRVAGSGVVDRKVRAGTANMVKGPAMSREEAIRSIRVGVELAGELIDSGVTILATGDMGIGNTTASSAVISALSGLTPGDVTGSGTGIDGTAVKRKIALIQQAIAVNRPDPADPVDVLAKVGGLEIGGLAGIILGGAGRRCPVVIDGFISSAAALLAAKLAPKSVNYMIASHLSVEPGHRRALNEIGLTPMLHMDMRLGEGTGAVLAMNIVEAAAKVIAEMATFDEAGVAENQEKAKIEVD